MESVLLEFNGISKQYPGVRALDDVSFQVLEGEILGLVGENGAGKSTILNVASGVIQASEGTMVLRGEPFRPASYHDAMLRGVSRVFQEQALVPNLAVYENMLLSHENRFSFHGLNLNRREMVKMATEELKLLNSDIDPTVATEKYNTSTRQVIEIAKACSVSSLVGVEKPVILLDEPTAALTGDEAQVFFDLIRTLKSRASFVFVSHRLEEILSLCDRICVLKDGRLVSTLNNHDRTLQEKELHELMVGREREADYYIEHRQRMEFGHEVLRVEGLGKEGYFEGVDLTVHEGEIVGVGGVLGSGKTELGRAIAGVEHIDQGRVWIGGKDMAGKSILGRMDHGVGFVPQERHAEGVALGLSVAWNITLASMHDRIKRGPNLIDVSKEREVVNKFVKDLRIKTPSTGTLAYALSGGNQQKVVLAKWLMREPKLLILDNPTFGIDVGNKAEIYAILRGLAENGMAIMIICDELLELIGLSNRIVVMKDGKVSLEVPAPPHAKPTETDLVKDMV